jgi:hypothetical protein
MPVLRYRGCRLSILILFCQATCIWSFVSVFHKSQHKHQLHRYSKQLSTGLFVSGSDNSFASSSSSSCSAKEMQLVDYLDSLYNKDNTNDRLPCGLDCTEKERLHVSTLVNQLLLQPENKANGNVVPVADILGDWNLLYTSSRTMMINKSLSGLGRSESDLAKV